MSNIPCNCHPGSNRRTFLADLGQGFTGLVLGAMLARDGIVKASEVPEWQPPTGHPHFTPKAKSVIWLFMNGGMSHIESFDYKPEINKYADKSILETPYADTQKPEKLKRREVAFNVFIRHKLWPLQIGFQKRGESGIDVADWLPEIGSCIDDIAVIRSMYTTDDNHGAQTQFHSGRHVLDGDFPCLGAWVNYGLGSINENLPQYISMGNREYWNSKDGHYLGPAHDAVPIRIDPANPLDYARPASGLDVDEQQLGFDFVGE